MRTLLFLIVALCLAVPAMAVINVTGPYTMDTADTYVLQNDFTAAGTAFWIDANDVIIDFNGYTVTYADTNAAIGIKMLSYKNRIEIHGGTLIEGAAIAANDSTNTGYPAIRLNQPSVNDGANIHDMTIKWHAPQSHGISILYGTNHRVHHNTLVDEGTVITNRMAIIAAIKMANTVGAVVDSNHITCRLAGIDIGNGGEVYADTIIIESVDTNSYGIVGYEVNDIEVYDNIITGTGRMPVGIGFLSGCRNIKIHDNDITVESTVTSVEYGGQGEFISHSSAFRVTWDPNDIEFYDNDCECNGLADAVSDSVDANSWCLWLGGGIEQDTTGCWEDWPTSCNKDRTVGNLIWVHDNDIVADGNGAYSVGVAIMALGVDTLGVGVPSVVIENNDIASDNAPIALGHDYGPSDGWPLFIGNKIIKRPGGSDFYSIKEGPYDDPPSTGRFYNNLWQGQTDFEDMKFYWNGNGLSGQAPARCDWAAGVKPFVDIRKASKVTIVCRNPSEVPIAGLCISIVNADGQTVSSGMTDANGSVDLYADVFAYTNCDDYPAGRITEDFLEAGAHKVTFNDHVIHVTNCTATYGTYSFTATSTDKGFGITVNKTTGEIENVEEL